LKIAKHAFVSSLAIFNNCRFYLQIGYFSILSVLYHILIEAENVWIPCFAEIFDEYTTALEDFIEKELIQVHPVAQGRIGKLIHISRSCLGHPDPQAPLSRAVSHVLIPRGWSPPADDQQLNPAESRCSAFDRELLAAYFAFRHFRFLMGGHAFHILTLYTECSSHGLPGTNFSFPPLRIL